MADEETPVDQDAPAQTPEAEAAETDVTEEVPFADEPAAEPEESPVDASEDDPAPAESADAAQAAPAAAAPAPPAEPQVVLSSKERRRHTRQRSTSGPGSARTPQERKAERDALRAKDSKARATRRHKERERHPSTAKTAAVETEPVERGRQKVRQGIVTSNKGEKTITVRIDISRRHRRYEKIVRSTKSLHVHDENNDAHEGDLVRVIETRPLSRTKRWRLDEILERAR